MTLAGCLMAMFVLTVLAVASSGAQTEGTPPNQQKPDYPNSINQSSDQNSSIISGVTRRAWKIERTTSSPVPENYSLTKEVDRRGYAVGYRAGYCRNEISGYYNGAYSSWAPPIVRDGCYGYNAPNPFCENGYFRRRYLPIAQWSPQSNASRLGSASMSPVFTSKKLPGKTNAFISSSVTAIVNGNLRICAPN